MKSPTPDGRGPGEANAKVQSHLRSASPDPTQALKDRVRRRVVLEQITLEIEFMADWRDELTSEIKAATDADQMEMLLAEARCFQAASAWLASHQYERLVGQ